MSGPIKTVCAGGFDTRTGEVVAKTEAIDTPPRQLAKVLSGIIHRYVALRSQLEETTPRQLLRELELQVGAEECRRAEEAKKGQVPR